jgi:two-component system chemotaxis response regulator CheY
MQHYRSILICDDEAHIRQLVSHKLRGAGYEVAEARDGAEGLARAQASPPRLIVTDLQMPTLNGLDMIRALRTHEATRSIPVIMLTARGYFVPEEEARALLIREIVPKPFGLKALLDKIGAAMAEGEASSGGSASKETNVAA